MSPRLARTATATAGPSRQPRERNRLNVRTPPTTQMIQTTKLASNQTATASTSQPLIIVKSRSASPRFSTLVMRAALLWPTQRNETHRVRQEGAQDCNALPRE